jgi:hypothetical protein
VFSKVAYHDVRMMSLLVVITVSLFSVLVLVLCVCMCVCVYVCILLSIAVCVVFCADCALPVGKGITGARGVAGTVFVHKVAGAEALREGMIIFHVCTSTCALYMYMYAVSHIIRMCVVVLQVLL